MPTITCSLSDIQKLTGQSLTVDDLEKHSYLFKGEIKAFDPQTSELRIELQDTNRPDLWSVEGIARQLRFWLSEPARDYRWLGSETSPAAGTLIVHREMQSIRPFAAGFAIRGLDVTEDVLIACIQTQEKLAGGLGRNRKTISIGIYDLNMIRFPVHYKAVGLDELTFVPLGFETPMTPRRILETHPKGMEYRYTLEGFERVPILMDDAGEVLSFPPIINSRKSGEVKVGRRDLFVEATGTDIDNLILALNIFAANLADRGGRVESISVEFEFETARGSRIMMPFDTGRSATIRLDEAERLLGKSFTGDEAVRALVRYGYKVEPTGSGYHVVMPPWRRDLMHHVDIIEDLAIATGFDRFKPEMPQHYTIGNLSPMTLLEDRIRDMILGFGFEEIISNILGNKDVFSTKMREPERNLVVLKNPMTENYACLRDRILPSLLLVEKDSSGAAYPHRIFETGEITEPDPEAPTGCRTRLHAGLLIADKESDFSTLHSYLELIMFNLDLKVELVPDDPPQFIPGRSGSIITAGSKIGVIGELHPELLESFQIGMPCSMMEIDLAEISRIITQDQRCTS